MKKTSKIVFTIVLVGLAAVMTLVCFRSVTRPIDFEAKAKERDKVVIERLIDIKDAQVEYRKKKGQYTNSFDSLIHFLNNEKVYIVTKEFELNDLQLDLIAGYKKSDLKIKESQGFSITPDDAHAYVSVILAKANETGKWDRINEINALNIVPDSKKNDKEWIKSQLVQNKYRRDTIVTDYKKELYGDSNYPADSLRYVPFGNGEMFELITNESGELFEARADFEVYMKGIDDQELANYLLKIKKQNQELRRIPQYDEKGEQKLYADGTKVEELIPCRIIGNAETFNNNAGNWTSK